MAYRTIEEVKVAGFEGFKSVAELHTTQLCGVPTKQGIYLVLRTSACPPQFLEVSPGGHFKGKDPTERLEVLKAKWVSGAIILNVGKAGGINKMGQPIKETLRSRLKKYLDFGSGKPIGHWGGRYIWQLADSDQLLVCWKITPNEEPIDVEQRMMDDFSDLFNGKYPFANCRRSKRRGSDRTS